MREFCHRNLFLLDHRGSFYLPKTRITVSTLPLDSSDQKCVPIILTSALVVSLQCSCLQAFRSASSVRHPRWTLLPVLPQDVVAQGCVCIMYKQGITSTRVVQQSHPPGNHRHLIGLSDGQCHISNPHMLLTRSVSC